MRNYKRLLRSARNDGATGSDTTEDFKVIEFNIAAFRA